MEPYCFQVIMKSMKYRVALFQTSISVITSVIARFHRTRGLSHDKWVFTTGTKLLLCIQDSSLTLDIK